jgi:hypothetical protein
LELCEYIVAEEAMESALGDREIGFAMADFGGCGLGDFFDRFGGPSPDDGVSRRMTSTWMLMRRSRFTILKHFPPPYFVSGRML